MEKQKTGVQLIAAERREQIKKHGHTIDSDRKYDDPDAHHTHGDLAYAALYALWPNGIADFYPAGWDDVFKEKLRTKNYRERLIVAGALIAAELDRLNRIRAEAENALNDGLH